MEKFVIVKDNFSKIRRFNLRGRKIEFKLCPAPATEEPVAWIKDSIQEILNKGTEGLLPTDKVGITFCDKSFEHGPGWINFQDAGNLNMDDVWGMISSIYQSNSTGLNTETFYLGVTSVRLPTGRGNRRGRNYNTFNEECNKRRGIITINNKDNLCLPRALVVAKAYVESDPAKNKVRQDIGKLQTIRAKELLQQTGIAVPASGYGIPELNILQRHLKDYSIVVYSHGIKGRETIFKGPQSSKRLNLLHHEGHFNVVTSLTAAFCCSYFCEECSVPYNRKEGHRCRKTCYGCRQSPSCPPAKDILCQKCNRKFRGPNCLENHRSKGICDKLRRCIKCLKTITSNREHHCGEIFCKNCRKHQPVPHLCFIHQDIRRPPMKDFLFIFYDLETRQEEENENGKVHTPNLGVFQQRCSNCINKPDSETFCEKCGIRRSILTTNPVERLIEFVINQRKSFKMVIVIAHNGGSFDHQFIVKYLLEQTDLKPELIMRGTKIIMMKVENLKFLDSLNYFPMPLSALPTSFGFDELKKGYFPHLFNTIDNQNYVGPLPSIEFYDPDNMKPGSRETFLKWHEDHENDEFDFQKELVDYCISDVQILTDACLKFRKIMLDECNVCPFTEATTIASACNLVFRRKFLQPNTIGLIPKNGYRMRDNQSSIALKWLIWESDKRQIKIQHAGNGREVILSGLKVDGYCTKTNQVFEFYGCYYHGHLCIRHNRDKPLHEDHQDTLDRRYEMTVAKMNKLRSFGYEVIEMWQCDFKITSEMDYLNTHPLLSELPLDPRDAFFGGRTGNTKTYHKCEEGEKIKYLDVCSLYPYICKYGKFPIKHPILYVGDDDCSKLDLHRTSGLIKCTILPPQELFHPVLPQKMNNKLMFALCRTCGENMTEQCTHDAKERALTGTWVTEEVIKALEMGYEMVKIHEVWAYETVQKSKDVEGLFTKMMDKFLKIKQEASGWPSHCESEEEKQKYINDFRQREDIKLEYDHIFKNSGLRTLAKLMLNSFWGKFGQRENQPKTSIVNDPAELFSMLSNPAIEVQNMLPVNEATLVVNWQYKEEASDSLATVNVVTASYVTAQARLKLYSYIQPLDKRAIYMDTDSVIFVSKGDENEPSIGEFIGDMTDELEGYGPGSYITEFVCGGPKNYAFKVYSPSTNESQTICKVKGITLSHKNSKIVNFTSIRDMVLCDKDIPLLVSNKNFRRKEFSVITSEDEKMYKLQSNKRKFFNDHSSLPYGYKKLKVQGKTNNE